MNTILVPLDGSPLGEQALPQAEMLARRLGASIRLLRVISTIEHETMIGETILGFYGIDEPRERYQERERRVWELERERAESYLAWRASQIRATGIDTTCEVELGPPPEVIGETASRCRADMIVMATHGASGLRRWALGSVADRVVQTATTPVLVVRGASESTAPPALERIVLPLDGSDLAKQALPLAAELARECGAKLVLFQSISPNVDFYHGMQLPKEVVAALQDQARAELEMLASELRAREIVVDIDLVVGHAAEAIVDEAARRDASLIVMATHGYSGLKRWALGSIADKVLHATRTPLALVHAR